MKKQIVANIFSNYAANVLGMALGFLLVPFLLRHLGKEAFGLIVLAESTILFFEVATVSIRIALSRYATFSLAQGRKDEFDSFLSTGKFLLMVSAAAVLLVGSIGSVFFPHIFSVPDRFFGQSKVLFLLITAAFTISIPNSVYWSVLYAKHRFDLINLSFSSGVILKGVLIFLLFTVLPPAYVNLVTYGIVYFVMTWMQNFAIYVWHKRIMPEVRIDFRRYDPAKIREILSFSTYTALGRASSLLYQNTANVLINLFWGPGANAVYSISTKFPQLLSRLFEEATYSLTSAFNELAAKNDRERLRQLFFSYTKALTIVTAPVCLTLILFADPLIDLWVGDQFRVAAQLLPILVLPLFLRLPTSVCGCVLTSYAKHKISCLVSLGTALLNVLLGVLLGKFLGLGLFGIALAASGTTLAYCLFFIPIYTCRIAGIPVMSYFWQNWMKPLASAALFFGGAAKIIYEGRMDWGPAIAVYLLAVPLYLGATYGLILDPAERSHVRDFLAGLRKILMTQSARSRQEREKENERRIQTFRVLDSVRSYDRTSLER